jgi:hypothetical protein
MSLEKVANFLEGVFKYFWKAQIGETRNKDKTKREMKRMVGD